MYSFFSFLISLRLCSQTTVSQSYIGRLSTTTTSSVWFVIGNRVWLILSLLIFLLASPSSPFILVKYLYFDYVRYWIVLSYKLCNFFTQGMLSPNSHHIPVFHPVSTWVTKIVSFQFILFFKISTFIYIFLFFLSYSQSSIQ